MLRVRALSGDPVAELHVEVLKATVKEGSLVLALKRFVAATLGSWISNETFGRQKGDR